MDYIDVHTHRISLDEKVFAIVNSYPNTTDFSRPFSIGIHPWFLEAATLQKDLVIVAEKLQEPHCFALGECGLDTLTATDFELQKVAFKKQILLSEQYKKPLIIHCVKAVQELLQLKKEIQPTQTWVFHGFNKNIQVAQSLQKNGIVLSFGAAIIHSQKLQAVLLALPLEGILLETDDAEEPIEDVYEKVATLKQIAISEVKEQIRKNFKNIFIR